ncbi:winged helix-turn-helix transcriptional regulator [Mucilaginibacter lutimaris]|uniref:Winged helix-turn-helix transcriptional regulator n=1 Tax=Mucilaginibacter lutimaris TaxID=931629 RepID=A0ABW2ZEN4_9SPHI
MKENKKRSDCPVSNTLEILGDKWSLLIVRDLMYKKKCTYGDFLKSSEGIATNILAAKLVKLEDSKIIKKQAHPGNKSSVLYTLTEKGIELLPTMIEMSLWAEKYFDLSAEWKSVLETVKKDKTEFLQNLMDKLKAETGS